ncbi:MAG: hypothetical protein O2887_07145 [Bacteroidetes bacterium]|nr:hypothetical protein [Bacteroidota bacterium]MDA1120256.1 hypothetical protein [Bacteroidota bacterium]
MRCKGICKSLIVLIIASIINGCGSKYDQTKPDDILDSSILPKEYRVDIPNAISFDSSIPEGRVRQVDFISGGDIYESLRGFIWVGESAADILEELFAGILDADIDNLVEFSVISDDDGRQKDLTVRQRVSYGGVDYRYELNAYDEDGERAAQILWNIDPIEVIAVLSPYDINRNDNPSNIDVLLRIDYSEVLSDYEVAMTIHISGVPADSTGLDNIKMFAGRRGDLIEVFGNSNHPNLKIIDETFTGGRNYAFVGRANETDDIAVAEIALPPSAVDTNIGIMNDYSLFNILEDELNDVGITNPLVIEVVLKNAQAPAYFIGDEGFVSSGNDLPDHEGFSKDFIDLTGLIPFIPRNIRDLQVEFLIN